MPSASVRALSRMRRASLRADAVSAFAAAASALAAATAIVAASSVSAGRCERFLTGAGVLSRLIEPRPVLMPS